MRLPDPRGPMSEMLVDRLHAAPGHVWVPPAIDEDPLGGEDLHLCLYVCYELHYRGFEPVDERWEWEPSLIAFRGALEQRFERALRAAVGPVELEGDIEAALRRVIAEDAAPSLSSYLEQHGTLAQFREFVVHRSAYQLKEADPHSWAIPRLDGAAKAALVDIQHAEYGSGSPEAMHAELFRRTMRGLGLDPRYGAYLDAIPGFTLATVNLMSMFGLHRRLRGAIVGHLALFEMTSTEPNARYAAALRRLGADEDAIGFYDEHVEADSDHEIVAARGMAGGLIADDHTIANDVLFGAKALLLLEDRFAEGIIGSWREGRSSLRVPIELDPSDADDHVRPAPALAG